MPILLLNSQLKCAVFKRIIKRQPAEHLQAGTLTGNNLTKRTLGNYVVISLPTLSASEGSR